MENRPDRYAWADTPARTAFPVASAGYPYIFAGAFVTLVFALLEWEAAAVLFLVVTALVILFFRDPDRVVPAGEKLIVAPADGRIVHLDVVEAPPFIEGPALKVSIFMSVANVHINRFPVGGTLLETHYHPGRFINASLDKASEHNERNALVIRTDEGPDICVVQVAGLVARRIISWPRPGDHLSRGQRFGLICFGSRVDCYLPPLAQPKVRLGDRVKGGTSVLGVMP
ncbi:MAG: phosphatidylserine decarboxylase family protein [Deltaproteobacteria bacterium]|nr:phosphatidylserine decarboxylase family protein [Deltaproteobacteria bacterium]